MTGPGNDGVAQHAAPVPARTGILSSLPGRTIIQGVAIDVLLAVALGLTTWLSSENPDWTIFWSWIGKTALMALASAIMKWVKPPVSPPG